MAVGTDFNVAVVEIACVFPGAHSPVELWQNVLAGRRMLRKAPPERLPLEYYYDPSPEACDKTYSDQLAVIQSHGSNPLACPLDRTIGLVLADAEFDSERNHAYIRRQLGAQSVIPAKRGKKTWRIHGVRAQMRRAFPHRLYRRRAPIESIFSSVTNLVW